MKKLLMALLAALLLFPTSVKNVFAQDSGIKEVDRKISAIESALITFQENQEKYSADVTKGGLANWILLILGGFPELMSGTGEGGSPKFQYSEGFVGHTSKTIAMMYGHPAATTERYVADVLNSAGVSIAQPAYAQGLGFASLDPILDTWKTFRNVAYFFFVIIFLVIGVMIMLRQKIGGQTVVTIQQAIPQIIVALLTVTFSYAIAGLLIDAMYLLMYLLLSLFSKTSGQFLDHNFLTLGWAMIISGADSAYGAVSNFTDAVMSGSIWNDIISFMGDLTLAAVVAIAIALKIFELFFELLKTYVTIILLVAVSPILLMFGAIPGRKDFATWVGNLVGNLSGFVIVLLVLLIFDMLTGGGFSTSIGETVGGDSGTTVFEGGGFIPPYLLNTGTGFSGAMSFLVGLGMLLIMPQLVKKGKEAMGAKEGIFNQFAIDIKDSLSKGWKDGGELVPGIGFTKVPGVSDAGKWARQQAYEKLGRPAIERYKAGGIEAIIPTGVQQQRTELSAEDIPPELRRGRTVRKPPPDRERERQSISRYEQGVDNLKEGGGA